MDKDTVRRWICRPFASAGIAGPRVHPHALRKMVATDLLRAQNDVSVVARVLHHRSPDVTLRSYDKRGQEELLTNLVIPVEWKMTVTTNDDLAAHLRDEMALNRWLYQQNELLRELVRSVPELYDQFRMACDQRGISSEPPRPCVT